MTMGDEQCIISTQRCPFCGDVHELSECVEFKIDDLNSRLKAVEKKLHLIGTDE